MAASPHAHTVPPFAPSAIISRFTGMQSIIQRLRLGMSDAPDRFEILDAGRTHGLNGTELRKQTFLILLADTGDAVSALRSEPFLLI